LRYRKTPPREDIRPKRLNLGENANVNFFGNFENNNTNFNNYNKNSVENNGYFSGKSKLNFLNLKKNLYKIYYFLKKTITAIVDMKSR